MKVLRQGHPFFVNTVSSLVLTYGDQEQSEKSKNSLVQMMEMCLGTFGPGYPGTLSNVAILALAYMNQRWQKAEELFVQVIETRKKVLGQERQQTLIGICKVGVVEER